MFFSTGGSFSRRPRAAGLGAVRLARRVIDRGPARRESRPRPPPVARAVRSQSRKNQVSFAVDPSGAAVPSRLREKPALRDSHSRKKRSVDPIHFPNDMICRMGVEFSCPANSALPRAHVERVAQATRPSAKRGQLTTLLGPDAASLSWSRARCQMGGSG